MAKRQGPSFDERVLEYVDCELTTHRVRYGHKVAARMAGNYGVYRVFAACEAKKLTGGCSCPSEIVPCKHIHALRKTWELNPQSFFDLDQWLKGLSRQPKSDLLDLIGEMVVEAPNLLGLFDIDGFDVDFDEGSDY